MADPRTEGDVDLVEPGTPLPDPSRGDRHGPPDAARLAFTRPPAEPRTSRLSALGDRRRRIGDRARELPTRQLATGLVVSLVGVGLLLGWVVHVSWTPLADTALLAIGVILVIQARRGPTSRPLIALGVLLAVVAAGTWRAGVTLDGGFGRRTVVATHGGLIDRQLGTGQLTIDLRKVPADSRAVHVVARVGIGRLVVIVPQGVLVATHTTVGGGASTVFSKQDIGGGVEHTRMTRGRPSKLIRIDGSVGIGSVEVRRG